MPATEQLPVGRFGLVNYLRMDLIGPFAGPEEEVTLDSPHLRYTMGVLFPRPQEANAPEPTEGDPDDIGEEDSGIAVDEGQGLDAPLVLAAQRKPSSLGLSFYFRGSKGLRVECRGAFYEQVDEKEARNTWKRRPWGTAEQPVVAAFSPPPFAQTHPIVQHISILEGRATVAVQWRRLGEGHLVTVSLLNALIARHPTHTADDECLYQVGFTCIPIEGDITEYPGRSLAHADPEELDLALLYRSKRTYAVGHGCAPGWEGDPPKSVYTSLLPTCEVPGMTATFAPVANHPDPDAATAQIERCLRVGYLADESIPVSRLTADLSALADAYGTWIDNKRAEVEALPARHRPAGERSIVRLDKTLLRIRHGIKRLEDPQTLTAFRLASKAMLLQRRQSEAVKRHGGINGSVPLDLNDPWKWYPFQLAFQLIQLEGLSEPSSAEREIVDLIWFPTGGGKTEAYLAVAAFELFFRRLAYGEAGGGLAVITRYTLRALASQQFERTARLICACERLRLEQLGVLGDEPFTAGFWAGSETTPNSVAEAGRALERFAATRGDNPFLVERCPWCGAPMVPPPEDCDDTLEGFGFSMQPDGFALHCPSPDCDFHTRLPLQVVDELLYKTPPSFLVGTIDKFARLAWVAEARSFFNAPGRRKPSLVIQDELHLIAGPLGTTAAVYEAALQALMREGTVPAKIIASTATIRSAGDQVRQLFGRDVALFPPAGLDADDSFFARVDKSGRSRLYAGVMSPHHKPSTSLIRLMSALLQGPEVVDLSPEEDASYRSLVVYHLSLRELGKTMSYVRDDIPARLEAVVPDESLRRGFADDGLVEMTSNLGAGGISHVLERLKAPPDAQEFVDVLVCTNMLSVGVDVPRLGLMVLQGQPKTTSEYIQASSRVGRGDVGGLVVAHFSAAKPRDRSHYEAFTPFHHAFYRYVEPTAVTPYAPPSRERALHAALVILLRHGPAGLTANEAAARFDADDPHVRQALETLSAAARRIDAAEADATERSLHALVDEWTAMKQAHPHKLRYRSSGEQFHGLLADYGPDAAATREAPNPSERSWPTLHSMRSVDGESPIRIIGVN